MDSRKLIRELYPKRVRRGRLRRARGRLRLWLHRAGRDRRVLYVAGSIVVTLALLVGLYIHYYNRLVAMRNDVETAWAQVGVERQRRFHIHLNMTRIILDYAKHERGLHQKLTEIRTGGTPESGRAKVPAPTTTPTGVPAEADPALPTAEMVDQLTPAHMARLFPKVQLVAERYANLRLTENYQQFSKALIETETRIAKAIMNFNAQVNRYTTALKQFPARSFAAIGGFEAIDLYQPRSEKLDFETLRSGGAR